MQVYNDQTGTELLPGLTGALSRLRDARSFDAEGFINAKALRLNTYMAEHGLKACVVAVSGGVDSAVVLGLVSRAASEKGSPIERIVAALLPVFDSRGATNQDDALARGRETAEACGVQPTIIDLTDAHAALKAAVDHGVGVDGEGWASGQLVSYARTPAYYYLTSLLVQQGTPAVVCGTTNRDEGAYLGYFGKASDGMVDVQLIADLHKSEVFATAKALALPASVINVIPAGDMYDGRHDEEVFGAPYDFVELYLQYLALPLASQQSLLSSFSPDERRQFDTLADRLEAMHVYNGHKYLGRSPAVHLNVLASAVPGGWDR
jgi:NAD+ synthase (glutamine-hydrolysing)